MQKPVANHIMINTNYSKSIFHLDSKNGSKILKK